jgi:choline dehydrogenase
MVSVIHTVPQVKKRFDWGFYAKQREWTIDRKMPYVRGKVLGGSSAINGMVFVRGNRANYDSWAAEGCNGWSFDEVLPYFRKLEAFEDGDTDLRGGEGPIKVTRAWGMSPVSTAFSKAVASTCSVPELDDYNGESQEGASRFQMSAKDGLRYSTSEGYLQPALPRPNLQVVSGAHVCRILFEKSRAVGVLYEHGGKEVEVRADRVVVCAGAVGSPHLLLRSGVGPAEHLRDHCIDVVADLPVGDNLHDHLFFPLTFLAPEGGHRGTPFHFFGGMIREFMFGGTWFSRTVFEIVAFLKTSASEPIPNLQLHSLPWAYPSPNQDAPGRPTVDMRPALTVQPTLIYPKSRGTIRLKSADSHDAPDIDPHFLEEAHDRQVLLDGIALTREIMASADIAPMITGELEPGLDFVNGALQKELANRVNTVYHPVGTCRMGVDDRAVVDLSLKVRGLDGLYVADASIMPSITGGNTNAPCIMIGEKAADILRA